MSPVGYSSVPLSSSHLRFARPTSLILEQFGACRQEELKIPAQQVISLVHVLTDRRGALSDQR